MVDASQRSFVTAKVRILHLLRTVVLPLGSLVAGGLFVNFLWTNWSVITETITPQMVLELIAFAYIAVVATITLALLDGLGHDVEAMTAEVSEASLSDEEEG